MAHVTTCTANIQCERFPGDLIGPIYYEQSLSTEPLRVDYLLLRRTSGPDGTAGTLRKLWDLLPQDTIVELKNGHTFRGQISRVKGSRVTLRVGAGECVFDLADVTLEPQLPSQPGGRIVWHCSGNYDGAALTDNQRPAACNADQAAE